MDASALSDVQRASGRLRRVGPAPSWQVPTPGSGDVGLAADTPRARGDGDTKAGLAGARTI